MSRVQELRAAYGSDAALGVIYDEEQGLSLLPDGGYAALCGDCAHYIRSREINTAVYGFWTKENPTWAGAGLVDGHDFAVVDERYIVGSVDHGDRSAESPCRVRPSGSVARR